MPFLDAIRLARTARRLAFAGSFHLRYDEGADPEADRPRHWRKPRAALPEAVVAVRFALVSLYFGGSGAEPP